jgi:hypothetical protein
MKSMAFWVITWHSLVTTQRFGEIYILHLQGRKVSQARNQEKGEEKFSLRIKIGVLDAQFVESVDAMLNSLNINYTYKNFGSEVLKAVNLKRTGPLGL